MPDFPPGADSARSAKIALRNHIITQRQSLSPSARRAAAVAIQAATDKVVRTLKPSTTAAYVPVGTEPGGADLPGVIARALPPDARLLLPVLLPDADLDWADLDWADLHRADLHRAGAALARGPRGLVEPTGARLGVDAVRAADLIIVPALAVDRTGVRMGRGGGSYDRALARTATPWTVALLYDGELLDHLPAEPHDHPVQAVITPTGGLIRLSGSSHGPGRAPGWTK